MYSLNSAAQEIVSYWETSRDIPFKGELISRDDDGNICMCAQGQVLYRLGGYTEEQLFNMDVSDADEETARILDISAAHSVFLRRINDKCEGSPQEVLSNPGKYLGPNWENVLNFWIYLDTLSDPEKEKMNDLYWALNYIVRISANNAAWNAATEVVGEGFSDAASRAAYNVTGWFIFGYATYELIARHILKPQATFIPLIPGIENL